jgi:hypothetical protein
MLQPYLELKQISIDDPHGITAVANPQENVTM